MELVGIGIFTGALKLLDCMATDLVVLLSPEINKIKLFY